MKKSLCFSMMGILLLTTTGCGLGQNGGSVSLMDQLQEDSEKSETQPDDQNQNSDLDTENEDADQNKTNVTDVFRQDMADFSITLWKETELGYATADVVSKENLMISPLSIIEALAMTANGADQTTLEQMQTVLGPRESQEELNQNLINWVSGLSSSEDAKFHLANSIWIHEGMVIVDQDFLKCNQEYYGAEIYEAAFDTKTTNDINSWVSENTDKMIPKIVEELNTESVMMLVNAIAFDAKWESEYYANDVWERPFTKESGEEQMLDMMCGTESIYLEDEYATGFIKPYKEGYSFVALLPEEGMSVSEYIATLTGERYLSILDNQETDATVITAIPKFTTEYTTNLNGALMQMGLIDAFDENIADFSRLGSVSYGNIYVSSVMHKTFIQVDELGTKAGAATAIMMESTASISETERKEVILDRPFVYAIIDNNTKLPLFLGYYLGEK